MRIFANPNYNFIKWRWHALIALGRRHLGRRRRRMCLRGGLPLGVDFSGGTVVVAAVRAADDGGRRPRGARSGVDQASVVQRYGTASEQPDHGPAADDEGAGGRHEPRAGRARRSSEALRAPTSAQFTVVEQGPRRARRSARTCGSKGIWATLAALGGILVYVAFRFRFTFAVGAIVATFHDILITLVVPDAGSATTCRSTSSPRSSRSPATR